MTRQKSQDRCVECGAPANRRLICPVHKADYGDTLVDDVDPAAREPAPAVLRVVTATQQEKTS